MKAISEPLPVFVGPSLRAKPFAFSAGRELLQVVHLEREVHQVGLHLHRLRAGRHLAQLNLLLAVRRGDERQLRPAGRGVPARDLQPEGLLVEFHGALKVVQAHAGVEELCD
jgi:hypothetical protein